MMKRTIEEIKVMATIKSYTDLEQSKKLAEILPIESADNVIVSFGNREGTKTVVMPKETYNTFNTPFSDIRKTTMCWSLAALIDVLPNNEYIETTISKGGWKIGPVEYVSDIWWCEYENTENQTEFHVSADNTVDACYEMILKLHELKML